MATFVSTIFQEHIKKMSYSREVGISGQVFDKWKEGAPISNSQKECVGASGSPHLGCLLTAVSSAELAPTSPRPQQPVVVGRVCPL